MKLRPSLPFGALLATAVLSLPALQPAASAAILAQDSFEYTPGSSLAGLNGGSGFSGGWTNHTTNTPASITGTTYDYQISGGALIEGGNAGLSITVNGAVSPATFVQTPAAIHRELAQTHTLDTVFVSFVLRQTGNGVSNLDRLAFWLGNDVDANGPYGGMLQTSSTGFYLRTDSMAPSPAASAPRFSANATYLIVLEFSKSVSGADELYDRARLWVNPAEGDFSTPLLIDSEVGGNAISSFSTIGVEIRNQSTAEKEYYFDNFVMGTTWNDVVPTVIPEPSTWAMLAVGAGAGLLARLQRRRYGKKQREGAQ